MNNIVTKNSHDKLAIVRIVFFSGTGCTTLVANTFKKELEASGKIVQMHDLRYGMPVPKEKYTYLIICFVVHASNAPPPVMHWVKSLPPVHKIPASVISVSGGGEMTPNLASRVAIKRKLKKKGFYVEYEKMLVMPSNWIVPTKPSLAARLLEILPQKVAFILKELIAGKRRTSWPGIGNRLLSLLFILEVSGAKEFGKRIIVNNTCNSCSLCARGCPVGNITIGANLPIFGTHCIMCLNCLYQCPQHALHAGAGKFILIKEGFDLGKIQATIPWTEPIDIRKEARGILWLGVKKYLLDTTDIVESQSGKT